MNNYNTLVLMNLKFFNQIEKIIYDFWCEEGKT